MPIVRRSKVDAAVLRISKYKSLIISHITLLFGSVYVADHAYDEFS